MVREVKRGGGGSDGGNRDFGLVDSEFSRAPTLYYYVINCNGDFNWENSPARELPLLYVRSFLFPPFSPRFPTALAHNTYFHICFFSLPSQTRKRIRFVAENLNSHVARNVLFQVISV